MAQLYGGIDSHFLKLIPMSSKKDLPFTLKEFIRDHGAMQGLKSDNAKSETSHAMHDILRLYCIKDKQSKPHYENQNPIERHIQDVKCMTNNIMDHVACPAKYWLLTMLFVVRLLNILVNTNGAIPEQLVTGEIVDVSPYLEYHFWEEVFCEDIKSGKEHLGRWCGPCHKRGNILTYWILLNDTGQLVARSNVCHAKDPLFPNRHARPPPEQHPLLETVLDQFDEPISLPTFSPEELIGMTFLYDVDDDQHLRAKVVHQVIDRDAQNHQNLKFLLSLGDGDIEELIGYNELCDIISKQHAAEKKGEIPYMTFRKILDHQGPLKPSSPNYKGSTYDVKVLWEDNTETWEPINILGKDDPVTLARYAREQNLLETPGWKFL